MIRVFLKILQLILHIKQPVTIQISIKKQQKTISIPYLFPLICRKALINTTYQFHMSQKNPSFQLCVVLCLNSVKKLAGWIDIGLNKLGIKKQQTIHIQNSLMNCPDKNSMIEFELMYMKSPFQFMTINLISEQQVHQMSTLIHISEIQQQRGIIQRQNKYLQKEYKQLVEENKLLYEELDNIQNQQMAIQTSWKQQLQVQQNKHVQGVMKLQRQKNKLAQILDIVFESGDNKLIKLVQQQIQQNNQQSLQKQQNQQINQFK